jgi:Trypsin-like peptidase domain/NACHT domain
VDEALVDRALVRICDASGVTRGTGFFIDDGTMLTCHHVVDGLEDPVAVIGDNELPVAVADDLGLSDLDVAVLECGTHELRSVLPLGLTPPPALAVWAKGFQYATLIPKAVPLSGTVSGRTAVEYTARRSYELDDVLALGGVTVDAGTSGAPLFDEEWGVVIGMVNAQFNVPGGLSGFALPLQSIVDASESLASTVERSRQQIPAYGPYLNVAAARATCAAALQDARHRLVARDLLLPDRYCARPDVAAAIDRAVSEGGKVVPIVGASGTGKTTELAALAERESVSQPMALVPCADLEGPAEEGLAGSLGRMLARAAPGGWDLDDAVGRLEDDDADLLVLLDALNEIPAQIAANERSWLAATFEWVRCHRVRLVVTCRPDHWELVARWFPQDLLPPHDSHAQVQMDDFTDAEASEALRRYELTGHGLEPDDVRHPLLARVYWELGDAGGALSRYGALEQFSMRLCADAALDSGLPTSSVRAVLTAVAQRTVRRGDLVLPIEDVSAIDGAPLQALVRRNVLLDVPAGLRFAFDELGEWHQAQHVGLDDLRSLRSGTAAFALLRLERERGAAALIEPLERLLADAPGDAFKTQIDFVLEQVVRELEDPAPVELVVKRWIDGIVEDRPHAAFLAARALRRSAIPTARRFELLGRLARTEPEWDWRHKRWRDLPTLVVGSSTPSAGDVAAELLREDPGAAADYLVRWFEDGTHEPSRAAPADVARGLLLHHCALAFDQICDAVASRGENEVSYMFDLTQANPEGMALVCGRWCAGDDGERRLLGSACARRLVLDPETPTAAREAARAAMIAVLDRADPIARTEALAGLYARDETRELVLAEVLATFRAGGSPLSAYVVAPGLVTHHDEVFEAMLDAISDSGRPDRGETLQALAGQSLDSMHLERIVDALDDTWLHAPLSLNLGRWLEDSLYRLEADAPIADTLLAFARRAVVDGGQDVRICVAYASTSTPLTHAELAWRRDLFACVLAATPPEEYGRLVGAVADKVREHPWILDAVLERTERPDADDLAVRLLVYASREPFGDDLVRAVRRRGGSPSPALRQFTQLVDAGMLSAEAAGQALERRRG